MSLADRLRASGAKQPPTGRASPLWAGPCGEGPQGGVTFSLLSRYLTCKERFRVHTLEGLRARPDFNHRMEFGNMWHLCEKAWAGGTALQVGGDEHWRYALHDYARGLASRYPNRQEEIAKWSQCALMEFPLYLKHWDGHPFTLGRKTLLAEEAFDERMVLPSGRVVRLRGRWDEVFLYRGQVWNMETKTKGDVDEAAIRRQCHFDLQTMLYLVALRARVAQDGDFWNRPVNRAWRGLPLGGVLYNVVRRPLSGGKGTVRRRRATKSRPEEGQGDYWKRVESYLESAPEGYFFRWEVRVTPADVQRFKRECLLPLLENLCDDHEWWQDCFANGGTDGYGVYDHRVRAEAFQHHIPRHYVHPFGVRNVLDEGGCTDVDEYLATGGTAGLEYAQDLFPELKD